MSIWRPTVLSTAFCYVPPIIGFSSTSWKDSVNNIRETGEFVWNLATKDLAKQMNATAAHVAPRGQRILDRGLTPAAVQACRRPRVAESPVSFECKLTQVIQLQRADGRMADAWLTLGEVVAVHIDKAMIRDGVYQTALARPIVRAGRRGDYFEIRGGRDVRDDAAGLISFRLRIREPRGHVPRLHDNGIPLDFTIHAPPRDQASKHH